MPTNAPSVPIPDNPTFEFEEENEAVEVMLKTLRRISETTYELGPGPGSRLAHSAVFVEVRVDEGQGVVSVSDGGEWRLRKLTN